MNILPIAFTATLAVALSACATDTAVTRSAPPASTESAQNAFFDRLTALCGQSFAGTITAEQPAATTADPFSGKALVMHVRECSAQEIRIPFHVGDDHSRTWVITRTDSGLRLKHDHRHEDGSDDAVTMYGGDTANDGTASRQEFPVDVESQEMFTRNGMTVSNTNTWAMEVEPGATFVYELARPQRLFRVTFDLTSTVATPPAPWGSRD